jgi:hypothetical protein
MTRQTMNAESDTTTPSNTEVKIGKTKMSKPTAVTIPEDHVFDVSACRRVHPKFCERQGFLSPLYKRLLADDSKIAFLVLAPSARGDYGLNESALGFLAAALQSGEIAEGYVVLTTGQELQPIMQISVGELAERLKDTPATNGRFGPYWWLSAEMRAVAHPYYDEAL